MQRATMFKITPLIRRELLKIIDERIEERHIPPLREDFSELKGIVQNIGITMGELAIAQKELAEAQKKTEARVSELAEAQKETQKDVNRLDKTMQELAIAQKRTEARVEELAEAQKKTEIKVAELSNDIKILAKGLKITREEVGGIGKTLGYSLENEAYRNLPEYLKKQYSIEITEKMVRTEIEGEEINIFGKARLNGKSVLIVGETEAKLSSIGKLKQLEREVVCIRKKYKEDIVRLVITHYVKPQVLEKAKEQGIIVIQSFEW